MLPDSDLPDPGQVFDDLVRAVALLLPFPVELESDMGYTGALFINLGRRGGADDPPDTASIDALVQPVVWVFDIAGGRKTVMSEFGPGADPMKVARWILEEAEGAGSPAALATNRAPGGE